MSLLRRGDAGVSVAEERKRLASGAWRELFPGVVWTEPTEPSALEWSTAALLWAGEHAVLGSRSAAPLHQLDGEWVSPPVHLIVPRSQALESTHAVVSRIPLESVDITKLEGLRCTTLSRTLIDLAAVLAEEPLATAFESAWRHYPFVREELQAHLKLAPKRRGAKGLRALLRDSRARRWALRSALEVLMWRFLKARRFPRPTAAFRVRDAAGAMEIDFAYPDRMLAIETDGRAYHGPDRHTHDRRRWQRLLALGWTVITVTWDDLTKEPDKLAQRLHPIFKRHPRRGFRGKKKPAGAPGTDGL